MVFLCYMEHEGQTNDNQKDIFRIGAGACKDYRRRAKQAILVLKNKFMYWPGKEETEATQTRCIPFHERNTH